MPQVIVVARDSAGIQLVGDSELVDILDEANIIHAVRLQPTPVLPDAQPLYQLADELLQDCREGAEVFIGVGRLMANALAAALGGTPGATKPVISVPESEDDIPLFSYQSSSSPVLMVASRVRALEDAAHVACKILSTGNHVVELAYLSYLARSDQLQPPNVTTQG